MQIVGIVDTDCDEARVHTIDVWFSERGRTWIVERRDSEGHQIGVAHRCDSKSEAEACLSEWLRTHSETHLIAVGHSTPTEGHVFAAAPRRAA